MTMHQRLHLKVCHDTIALPLANTLLNLSDNTRCSFHALPLRRGKSIRNSILEEKFTKLFGHLMAAEETVGAPYFDTFLWPQQSIARAEELAARLFGADDTLFVSCGTTLANHIAIEALIKPGDKVLVEKNTHQSVHFALLRMGAQIDYLQPKVFCEHSEKNAFDLEEMIQKAAAAEQSKSPYALVVFSGQSYDGVMYDASEIIKRLVAASPSLANVLVDEAWGAWAYFSALTRNLTAMHAAAQFPNKRMLNVVATQSAHKSLSALRQGSFIHCSGEERLGERLRLARFRLHTTSPSYPILASLDLARAQMEIEGEDLVSRSIRLAILVRNTLKNDPDLACFVVNEAENEHVLPSHTRLDPTKLSIRVDGLPHLASDVRDTLYRQYGIYISRYTRTSLLLNFHIGIEEEDVNILLNALRAIQGQLVCSSPENQVSNAFIIPYPPGVPIIVPGDELDADACKRINALVADGVRLFTVNRV